MPASGDIAEPPIPIMWMCFIALCASSILIDHRWFQNFQSAFAGGVQSRLYTQGDREHCPLGVANGCSENTGNAQWSQNPFADLNDRGTALYGRFASWEIAQHNSTN